MTTSLFRYGLRRSVASGAHGNAWALTLLVGALMLLLAPDCLAQEAAVTDRSTRAVRKIIILPAYDMSEIYGKNVSLRGPLSGEVFITDEVEPKSVDFMTAQVHSSLYQVRDLRQLEPTVDAAVAMVGIAPPAGTRSERIAEIQKLGRRQGADSVLCTYIYAFRNRAGNAYGVEMPAKVSFELNLIDVSSGAILWQKDFTETQKTLNENLFDVGKFIKRGGRWITAKEMARNAIDDFMQTFPVQASESNE